MRPKVAYTVAQVTRVDGRRLQVNGVDLTHHVPSLNFSQGERVFPYVATCGREIEALKYPADLMATLEGVSPRRRSLALSACTTGFNSRSSWPATATGPMLSSADDRNRHVDY